ncbi:Predicted kinase [Actinomyces denticolens]|uniref:Predicted kinase n=1 Tax=Actinomyces denticolens TaxID=52767 RepID=A0ABY1I0U5_9ACTO|nr:Predicted kinase [Actinomyces denticolens]
MPPPQRTHRRHHRCAQPSAPALVVLGGLPATGKSAVADQLCRDATWAWVRIDSIEQALRDSGEMGPGGVQGAGYAVGYAVAGDLLRSGLSVVAECVNPIGLTRAAWREVARVHGADLLEVELWCQDPQVHRCRAESRAVDIPGLVLPAWEEICGRVYEPWRDADLRIDTCAVSPAEAAGLIRSAVRAQAD